MSLPEDQPSGEPPAWALEKAAAELYDVPDRAVVLRRAWEIVAEHSDLESERHDEYDDPDEGGEG